MEKWDITQKEIEKFNRSFLIKKIIRFSSVGLLITAILVLSIYLVSSHHKINQSESIELKTSKTTTPVISNAESNQDKQVKVTDRIKTKETVIEDYTSYINPVVKNTDDNISIAVTIVDDKGDISSSVSNLISDIYSKTGNHSNTGLLRNSFIHGLSFKELFEGNSEIIEKLKLNNYIDYLALGRLQYSENKGTLVNGTIICTASLKMNIISTNQKSIIKSFYYSENGNGVTETQAKEAATEKLINKYYNEHSSL